jgi:hypothetical protein
MKSTSEFTSNVASTRSCPPCSRRSAPRSAPALSSTIFERRSITFSIIFSPAMACAARTISAASRRLPAIVSPRIVVAVTLDELEEEDEDEAAVKRRPRPLRENKRCPWSRAISSALADAPQCR